MTKEEANSKAIKLFNKWRKEFKGADHEALHYKRLEAFKEECLKTHNVAGFYEALSDKSALKMASICASIRFVEPHHMLTELQKTTGTY